MKQLLYQKLLNLQSSQGQLLSNNWATGQGIYNSLISIFGDEVHIIHPDLSSIHSPASNNDIFGSIDYMEAIEKLILRYGSDLRKPIIAIWNTASIRQTEGITNPSAKGGSHWQTLVILPKHYTKPNGEELQNEHELIMFKDSLYPGKTIPSMIKLLFKEKLIFPRNLRDGEIANNPNIEIGGMLKDAIIVDEQYSGIIQQEEGYDCGWWAIYNAFMFVMEGNGDFLEQFTAPSRTLGYKLRQIFSCSGLNPSEENHTAPQKAKNHNYDENIKLAIKNSLIDLIKQKYPTEYNVKSDFIKDLSHHYLAILVLLSESAESLITCCSTLKNIIREDPMDATLSLDSQFSKKLSINEESDIKIFDKELTSNFLNHVITNQWKKALEIISQDNNKIDICAEDNNKSNLLDYAARFVTLIQEYSIEQQEQLEACLAVVQQATETKIRINLNLDFQTPLHYICSCTKHTEYLYRLFDSLMKIADQDSLNCYNNQGRTPVLESIAHSNIDYAVRLIKDQRVDVNLYQILVNGVAEYETKKRYYEWRNEYIWSQTKDLIIQRVQKSSTKLSFSNGELSAKFKRAILKTIEESVPSEISISENQIAEEFTELDYYHGITPLTLAEHLKLIDVIKELIKRKDSLPKQTIKYLYHDSVNIIENELYTYYLRNNFNLNLLPPLNMLFRGGVVNAQKEIFLRVAPEIYFKAHYEFTRDFLANINLATLKLMLRALGREIILETLFKNKFTILHVAVSSKNIEIVKFLLDIKEINGGLPSNQQITEEEFSIFINYRNAFGAKAFEEALSLGKQIFPRVDDYFNFRHDSDKHYRVFEQQELLLLFLDCFYFEPNENIAFTIQRLPHLLLDLGESSQDFLFYCHKNKKINWNLPDSKGNSPLRDACLRNKPKHIKHLLMLHKLGKKVDSNDHRDTQEVEKLLEGYVEKGWLGPEVQIINLDIQRLVSALEKQTSVEIQIEYMKRTGKLRFVFDPKIELKEEIKATFKEAIQFLYDYYNNQESMECVNSKYLTNFPFVFESSSPLDQKRSYKQQNTVDAVLDSFQALANHEWWLSKSSFSINFKETGTVWIHGNSGIKNHYVIETRLITYEFLIKKIGKDIPETSFTRQYGNLLLLLAKAEYIECFRLLLEFDNLALDNRMVNDYILENAVPPGWQRFEFSSEIKELLFTKTQEYEEELRERDKRENEKEQYKTKIIALEADIRNKNIELNEIVKSLKSAEQELKAASKDQKKAINSEKNNIRKNLEEKKLEISKLEGILNSATNSLKKLQDRSILANDIKELVTKMIDNGPESIQYKFAQSLAYKLANINWDHGNKKFTHESVLRRLDSLSRLFAGKDVCCAITFDSKENKFLYSFNFDISSSRESRLDEKHEDLIDKIIEYLSKLASKTLVDKAPLRKDILIEAVLQTLFKRKLSIVEERITQISKFVSKVIDILNKQINSLPSISKYLIDIYGSFTKKDCEELLIKLQLNYQTLSNDLDIELISLYSDKLKEYKFNTIITTIFRLFYDIRKLERSIETSKKYGEAFSQAILKALKNKNFEIIKPNDQQSDSLDIHAEMRILEHFYINNRLLDIYYVGISKLCCSHCKLVFNHINANNCVILDQDQIVRGSHGDTYVWVLPSFLRDYRILKEIFAQDFGFLSLLSSLEKFNPESGLKIIQYIDTFIAEERFTFYNLLNFIKTFRRMTEADISTSAPGVTTAKHVGYSIAHKSATIDEDISSSVSKSGMYHIDSEHLPDDSKIFAGNVDFESLDYGIYENGLEILPNDIDLEAEFKKPSKHLRSYKYKDKYNPEQLHSLFRGQEYKIIEDEDIILFSVHHNKHYNQLLNIPNIINIAAKYISIEEINCFIELGENSDIAEEIILAIGELGIEKVLDIFFRNKFITLKMESSTTKMQEIVVYMEPQTSLIQKVLNDLSFTYNSIILLTTNYFKFSDNHQRNIIATFDEFLSPIHEFVEQLDLNWQVQKLFHLANLWKFESLKKQYGITVSFDAFRGSNSDFRKSVLLKLHPDKNLGKHNCNDDFVFVTNLREELSKPLDVQKFLNEKIQSIQPFIYKANMGFKVTDTAVDITRLLYIPTVNNAQKTLMDVAHIYIMYTGVNRYSALITNYDVINKFFQGEYTQTISQAATTISFMLLPTMLNSIGFPYIGFAYSIGLLAYTGYNAIANIQSLYNEFDDKNFKLNSTVAYYSITAKLSASLLQNFYDFAQKAKEYEKAAYKIKLEEKGEFGQKLYEYIYSLVIDEKYDLQNNLKAKHIKVMDYEHCIEVIELKEEDSDHYYCYNEQQQILDHIVIVGEAYIEKISSL